MPASIMQRLLDAAGWDAGSTRHKQFEDAMAGAGLALVDRAVDSAQDAHASMLSELQALISEASETRDRCVESDPNDQQGAATKNAYLKGLNKAKNIVLQARKAAARSPAASEGSPDNRGCTEDMTPAFNARQAAINEMMRSPAEQEDLKKANELLHAFLTNREAEIVQLRAQVERTRTLLLEAANYVRAAANDDEDPETNRIAAALLEAIRLSITSTVRGSDHG